MNKFLALSFAGLALFSCSQEESLTPVPSPEPEAPKTQVIEVDLEAGEDSGSLRLAQEVDPTTGHATQPFMNEVNVQIRLAVRRNGDANTITYQTKTFTKVSGANRARYSGQITIPAEVSGQENKYEIAGILLTEEGVVDKFTKVRGDEATSNLVDVIPADALATASDGKVETKLPYVCVWQELKVTDKVVVPLTMNFKPSGSLLRFKIDNKVVGKSYTVTGIKIKTDAFFPDWYYDFKALTGGTLIQGSRTYTFRWEKEYTLAEPVTVASETSSPWYYLWVMPASRQQTGGVINTDAPLLSTGLSEPSTYISLNIQGIGDVLAFTSSYSPNMGSIPVVLPIRSEAVVGAGFGSLTEDAFLTDHSTTGFPNDKHPYEYLASGVVNASKTGITPVTETTPNNDPGIAYLNWSEAQALNIPGYRLPTVHEWAGIITTKLYGFNRSANYTSPTQRETIQVGDLKFTADADYRSYNGVIYALRFIDQQNLRRTAYRYEWIGTFGSGDTTSKLKISIKHVGADASVSLTSISETPDFWTTPDKVIYLPASGYKNNSTTTTVLTLGQNGLFWSATENSANNTRAYTPTFGSASFYVGAQGFPKVNAVPVYLFKTNP